MSFLSEPDDFVPVRLRSVSKAYDRAESGGRYAVFDASFEIPKGQIVALTGPSGCGKSTLLNMIGCVDLPSEGAIFIEGVATTRLSDKSLTALRRTKIGTVFQFFNLLPALSVAENVALPLLLQRRGRVEISQRVAAVLEDVGIWAKARRYPSELSGGEAQRVAIARAIVHSPAIVLADEPTGNLDEDNAEEVMRLFRSIADAGQAIIMATHSSHAAQSCDRIVRMRDGRLQ
jgi:putative ABC transport system ATP-binding protein